MNKEFMKIISMEHYPSTGDVVLLGKWTITRTAFLYLGAFATIILIGIIVWLSNGFQHQNKYKEKKNEQQK